MDSGVSFPPGFIAASPVRTSMNFLRSAGCIFRLLLPQPFGRGVDVLVLLLLPLRLRRLPRVEPRPRLIARVEEVVNRGDVLRPAHAASRDVRGVFPRDGEQEPPCQAMTLDQ